MATIGLSQPGARSPSIALAGAGRGNYSSEANALFSAMLVAPSEGRRAVIDALIRAMKADGSWYRMDVFYALAAHDSTAALLNWKSPGTFTLTANNSPTFTVDQGFKGDGVSADVSSTLDISTFSGQYTLNDAMLGIYVHLPNTLSSAVDMVVGNARLTSFAGPTNYGTRVNDASASLAQGAAPAVGHYVGRRSVSTGREVWKSGVRANGPDVVASTSMATGFFLLSASAAHATPSNARLSCAYAGGALSAGQMLSFHNSLMTYLMAVGAA